MSEQSEPSTQTLPQITINSPCQMDWDLMTGDDRVRFCRRCKKDVYNVSELTEVEASELFESLENVCARIYQRPDGTIVTQPCPPAMPPVSAGKKRFQFSLAALLVLVTSSAGLCASAPWFGEQIRPLVQRFLQPTKIIAPTNLMPIMGDCIVAPPAPNNGVIKMGKVAAPQE